MTTKFTLFLLGGYLLCSLTGTAQSVGIGTESPNTNAILELVAPNNNQGLLVPRMSTAQRTATTFTDNLSASDNGLMVYDVDENTFFFWINAQWVELATGNLSSLPNQTGQSGRYLTTDGTIPLWSTIDFNTLSNVPEDLTDGDDNTQLSDADIATFGYIKSADDADASPTNELQDLLLSGNTLGLTNSSITIDLAPFTGTNTDNQTINLTGTDLSISGGNTIDISTIDTNLSDTDITALGYIKSSEDADADPTNENQTVTAGTGISVTQSGQNFQIFNDSPDQTVNLNAGSNVSISGSYPNFTINVPSVNDSDSNSSNEVITNLNLSGTTLEITEAGATSSVNLASIQDGTGTDNQNLSFSGNSITITNGNSINLSSSAPSNGQVLKWNGSAWEANNDNTGTGAPLLIDGQILVGNGVSNTGSNVSGDLSLAGSSFTVTQVGGESFTDVASATSIVLSAPQLDVNAGDDFSGDFSDLINIPADLADGDDIGITSESDPTVPASIKDGIDWSELSGIPSDISDGDDTGITSESDPTVPAAIKDGIDWSELSGIPSDISDGDDVNDADASSTNELNTGMSISGTSIRVTDAGGTRSVNIGGTFATDAELAASDAADGDKDGSNEIQMISRVGTTLNLSNSGGSVSIADNDNSSSNELNTGMSLSGTTIRVTDAGGTQSVNIGGTFATDAELNSRTFNPSAFKATTKATAIPTGFSTLVFDTEVYDIDGSYDASGAYTVPEDGFYNFGGQLVFQNIPTGFVQILILDATSNVLYSKAFAPNSIQSSIGFSVDLRLNTGDKISVGISNTGESNTIQIVGSPDQTNFFFCGKRFN